MTTLAWLAIGAGVWLLLNVAFLILCEARARRAEQQLPPRRDFPIWPPPEDRPDWEWPKDRPA